jgi:hypothetical protein
MNCKICESRARAYARATVRNAHATAVFQCESCGFVFFDPVTWLSEAYAEPIDTTDVGYVARNVEAAEFVARFLLHIHKPGDFYCDYGAGYGMFVRLMRDRGFPFHWHDPLCRNLFASYCEAVPAFFAPYRAVTAIEVFEHLPDPVPALAKIIEFGSMILFTTVVIPSPAPPVERFPYFGFEHGQHVSFYTPRALHLLAERVGLQYSPFPSNWHLFGTEIDLAAAKGSIGSKTGLWKLRRTARPQAPRSLLMDDFAIVVGITNGTLALDPAAPRNLDWIRANGQRTPTLLGSRSNWNAAGS